MAEYRLVRGDRYAITAPITKDGTTFDLTSGGTWVTVATLGQGDVIKATTEAESDTKCTLTVANGNGYAMITICNSTKLAEGVYDLELRTTDAPTGTTAYTWPCWSIRIVEPQRI